MATTIMRKLSSILKKFRGPDCLLVSITVTIIPTFYFAEILYILPVLYERWSFWYNVHFINSLFMMHNIIGNLAQGLQGPGNVRDDLMPPPTAGWHHCDKCECTVPPRSWHCQTCEVCVFKRDHHCNFFGCCIGYYNFRYFYMFVLHVFIAMVYALVINVLYFRRYLQLTDFGWMSVFAFMFPFATLVVDWSVQNGYILLLVVNILFCGFTGYLLYYHTTMFTRGKTVGESKHPPDISYDRGLKHNLTDSFGRKWYLVFFSGLLHSPLPGDGTHWKKINE